MAQTHDPAMPEPFKTSRLIHSPRARVFGAWMSPETVREWFSPKHFTVPRARVEPRVGGAFEVCMRAPDGQEHWSLGRFTELAPETRLVIDMRVPGPDGATLFTALTNVDFADAPGGTRVDVVQAYTFENPAIAEGMVKGAPEGWGTTLDKLDALVMGGGKT